MIRVQPDEGVTIRFGSKVPGPTMEVRDVNMDFSYGQSFTEASPEAYERLILDVLLGEPSLFPQDEEVELSWKILDPIEKYWARTGTQARAVRRRDLGPGIGGRHDGPRRPGLAATVTGSAAAPATGIATTEDRLIIDLPSTTSSAINRKLVDICASRAAPSSSAGCSPW